MVANWSQMMGFYGLSMVIRQDAALHSKYRWLDMAGQRGGEDAVLAARGHVCRRAFSWLPAQFASQSDAPVGAPRRFGSTEHLSTEAIAAFVDGEPRLD